jgi:dTDP-4-dehydrorhamnose reductase
MPSVLVFGKSGQLATALRAQTGRSVLALGRGDVDITSADAVRAAIRQHLPGLVINASAYTAVDKAEAERDAALALNSTAPGVMAACSAEVGAAFVHVSTDYVFDGEQGAPYMESHPASPVNFYGETKRRGEQAVLEAGGRAAVIRTSWVFSGGGANFVRTMLRLARDREEIGVVGDQYGRPTGASDLAEACLAIGDRMSSGDGSATGIFHFANSGDATWAEFADAVMREAAGLGLKHARIRPITTADYPTPAKRPRDSRLATVRFEALMGAAPRPWIAPLREAVHALAAL